MFITLILSIILMLALFLMLWGAVGFVQDKRFFGSASKEVQEKVTEHAERFKGQHILGWIILIVSVLMMAGTVVYGWWDGSQNGYDFWQFTLRFLIMLLFLKAFDLIFFDWFLLTKTRFFQYYYPETEGSEQYSRFGWNRKDQILTTAACPFIAAVLGLISVWIS